MTDLSTAPEASTPGWPDDTSSPEPTSDRAVEASPVFALDEPAEVVLARLESSGWLTLHGRVTPNQGFADHVSIGGGGIFVIDTHSFAITDHGPAMPSKEILASVEQLAGAVRSLLPPLMRQYVVPVVTFIDKSAMSIARGSVQVCTTSLLSQLIESRPTVLSSGEVEDVLHSLDTHLTSDPSARPTGPAASGTAGSADVSQPAPQSRADRKAEKAADKGERRGIRFLGRRGTPPAPVAETVNSQQRIEQQRLEAQQRELDRMDTERREAQRAEVERLDAERVAAERLEAERLQAQRTDAEREVAALAQAEHAEAQRVEAGRVEAGRVEAERLETERLEAERLETERLETERVEAERLETERLEAERLETERLEAEQRETERLEAERLEAERLEAERLEAERVEAERVETERLEAEQRETERLEAERLEAERLETERLEAERLEAERLEADRLETERLEAERVESERLEAERVETERLEAERLETQRLDAEGMEAERLESERLEAERVETERLEAERMEAERVATERAEASRAAAEREAVALAAAEQLQAQQIEFERQEIERLEAERLDAQHVQAGHVDVEQVAAEPAETEQAEPEHLDPERPEIERVVSERLETDRLEATQTAPDDDDLLNFMRDLRRSDRLHHDPHADAPVWDELSLADLAIDSTDESGPELADQAEPTQNAPTSPRTSGGRRKAPSKSWSARIKPGRASSTPGRRMATSVPETILETRSEAPATIETPVQGPTEPSLEPAVSMTVVADVASNEVAHRPDSAVDAVLSSPARVDLTPLYREQAPHSTEDRRELTRAERLADPERSSALSTVAHRWKQTRITAEPARPSPERESATVAAPAAVHTKQGAPIPGAAAEAPAGLSRRGRQMYAAMGENPGASDESGGKERSSKGAVIRKAMTLAAVTAVFALGALNFSTIKGWVEDHAGSSPSPATLNHKDGKGNKADSGKANANDKHGNASQ